MTREDVIRMAREAGFEGLLPSEHILGTGGVYTGNDDEISNELERFANLVATAEREACAEVCEQFEEDMGYGIPQRCANAIRARGEK